MYYDKQGRETSLRRWAELFEEKKVAVDRLVTEGGLPVLVSTVWLGVDHGWFSDVPIIFETMVFASGRHGEFPAVIDMCRYATERHAFAGHQEMMDKYAQNWWLDLGGRA